MRCQLYFGKWCTYKCRVCIFFFRLEFDFYLQCDQYFYGHCDKYCHPDPDKYSCDSSGSRVCKPLSGTSISNNKQTSPWDNDTTCKCVNATAGLEANIMIWAIIYVSLLFAFEIIIKISFANLIIFIINWFVIIICLWLNLVRFILQYVIITCLRISRMPELLFE